MRSTTRFFSLASAAALTAGLAGCAYNSDPYGPNNYPVSSVNPNPGGVAYAPGAPTGSPTYVAPQGVVEYGRVTNVALVSNGTSASGNTGAGTVIGGVVGGVLGNQIGHGAGRAAATILGAVGGAAVGNSLENRNRQYATNGPVYRVWVQTDSGATRTYDVASTGDLRPGDRVRIENGVIYLA
jgi:outer membrane lipoprotein SlyB